MFDSIGILVLWVCDLFGILVFEISTHSGLYLFGMLTFRDFGTFSVSIYSVYCFPCFRPTWDVDSFRILSLWYFDHSGLRFIKDYIFSGFGFSGFWFFNIVACFGNLAFKNSTSSGFWLSIYRPIPYIDLFSILSLRDFGFSGFWPICNFGWYWFFRTYFYFFLIPY